MNQRSSINITHQLSQVSGAMKAAEVQWVQQRYERSLASNKSKPPVIACDASGTILGVLDAKDLVPFTAKQTPIYDQNGSLLGMADPKAIQKADTGPTAAPAQQPAQPAATMPGALSAATGARGPRQNPGDTSGWAAKHIHPVPHPVQSTRRLRR